MTVNGWIAILQLIGGLACGYTMYRMFREALGRIWQWPVSALVATGGIIGAVGLMVVHIAWLRLWGTPFGWHWLGKDGYGTLLRTAIFAWVAVAFARRIKNNGILNAADRKAVKDGRA